MRFKEIADMVISSAIPTGGEYATVPLKSWECVVGMLRSKANRYATTNYRRGRAAETLERITLDCPAYSPRERQTVELLHQGLSDKQISERLGITIGTVKVMIRKCRQRSEGYKWKMLREAGRG